MFKFGKKIISFLICCSLIWQQSGICQAAGEADLSGVFTGSCAAVNGKYRSAHLRGISYDASFGKLRLLLERGEAGGLKDESSELFKYFLLGLALPGSSFWVNLSPGGKDEIIDPFLEATDMGRLFLESDVRLKKDTARMLSPETAEGREYWEKFYRKAEEIYGFQAPSFSINTRTWIVPDEIIIRENKDSAYIYKATLKVMLEQDYLGIKGKESYKDTQWGELNEYSAGLMRKSIIPGLNRRINNSQEYASLRQIYYSLIMAQWFKSRFAGEEGEYCALIDSRDLNGLRSARRWSKDTYFSQYRKSFNKGEFEIKEQRYGFSGRVLRSYLSGGINIAPVIRSDNVGKQVVDRNGGSTLLLSGCGEAVGTGREVRVEITSGREAGMVDGEGPRGSPIAQEKIADGTNNNSSGALGGIGRKITRGLLIGAVTLMLLFIPSSSVQRFDAPPDSAPGITASYDEYDPDNPREVLETLEDYQKRLIQAEETIEKLEEENALLLGGGEEAVEEGEEEEGGGNKWLLLGGGAIVWETLHTLILFFAGRLSTKLKLKKKKAGGQEKSGEDGHGNHNHIEELISKFKAWKDSRPGRRKVDIPQGDNPKAGISEEEIGIVIESLRDSGTAYGARLVSSKKIDLRSRIRFIHDEIGFDIVKGEGRGLLGRRTSTLKAQKILLESHGLPLNTPNFLLSREHFIKEEFKKAGRLPGWSGLNAGERLALLHHFCEVYGLSPFRAADRRWSGLLSYFSLPDDRIEYTWRAIDLIQRYELSRFSADPDLLRTGFRLSKIRAAVQALGSPVTNSMESYLSPEGFELYREREGGESRMDGRKRGEYGGIDLRSLPINRQALDNLSTAGLPASADRLETLNINRELRDIYRLIDAGITPSPERIREFVQACCLKDEIATNQDRIMRCIAEIIRLDEERLCPTDIMLRDILVVLESSRNSRELRGAFFGMSAGS